MAGRRDTVAVLTKGGWLTGVPGQEMEPTAESKYRCRITFCRTRSRRSCHRRLLLFIDGRTVGRSDGRVYAPEAGVLRV